MSQQLTAEHRSLQRINQSITNYQLLIINDQLSIRGSINYQCELTAEHRSLQRINQSITNYQLLIINDQLSIRGSINYQCELTAEHRSLQRINQSITNVRGRPAQVVVCWLAAGEDFFVLFIFLGFCWFNQSIIGVRGKLEIMSAGA